MLTEIGRFISLKVYTLDIKSILNLFLNQLAAFKQLYSNKIE